VGNIDALIYLSDALKKTCVTVEATIRKVAQLYLELALDEEKGSAPGEKKKKRTTKSLLRKEKNLRRKQNFSLKLKEQLKEEYNQRLH